MPTIKYHMKLEEVEKVLNKYKSCYEIDVIGKSVLGQDIYSVNKKRGENLPWVLIVAGMHAREHLSVDLVCKLIEKAANKKFDFNLSFVPLVNPDGVGLCIDGVKRLNQKMRERLVEINGSDVFSLFKANANGVDLNNNWDANWEKKFTDKTAPSSQGFYGYSPMSEPEVIALGEWTQKLRPALAISYHLKGEEIYFDFFQDEKHFERDEKIAQVFAKSSGYAIKSTQEVSSGGYKDWCVQKLEIPALTIELGSDKFSHPFPQSQLGQIYRKNRKVFKNIKRSLKIYLKSFDFCDEMF